MTLDSQALMRALSRAVRVQLEGYEVGEVLDQLTTDAAEILRMDGAAVSLADPDGAVRCVTATGEVVSRCEEWQETHQQGPSHDAFRDCEDVVVENFEEVSRPEWGEFPDVARGAGVGFIAAFPLRSSSRALGALTLYDSGPEVFSTEDRGAARVMADLATLYINNHRKLTETRDVAEQLQYALNSRIVIEQAKGIIAARHGIDMPKAFGMLRRHSRDTNTEIHRVAHAIVTEKLQL